MTSVFGRSRLFFGLVGLLSVASMDVLAAPTVALKAVAINGSPIPASRSVSVVPGDTITAEIFLSNWTTTVERLLGYQTAISGDVLVGGQRGNIMPVGWDRPLTQADDIGCTTTAVDMDCLPSTDCPAEFPCCDVFFGDRGVCVGLNHDPSQGVFIDVDRADFVFMNPNTGTLYPIVMGVDYQGPQIRHTAGLVSPSDAQAYSIPPKYGGTLILQVSDDACGMFSMNFLLDGTDLLNQDGFPIPNVSRRQLSVTVTSPGAASGQCSCLNVVATDIPNCTIDGRQPTDPDGSNNQIPRSVTFTFDCADTTSIASTLNFSRSFSPDANSPILATATPNGSDVTVSLTGPMREQSWNCITFDATGEGVCLGIMPGDVNSDARSQSFGGVELNDISALEECLNNPGTCTLFQCDIDRSGVCGPRDLLREIDLLVGTGAFILYDGKKITDGDAVIACPLAP